MASGGVLTTNTSPDYPQFNVEELKTIVEEAHVNDLKSFSSLSQSERNQ